MATHMSANSRDDRAKAYRRWLMFATVSPLIAMIVIAKFSHGNGWPWVVALPVLLAIWVRRDARQRDDPHHALWNVLAALPITLWLVFLVASQFSS